MYDILGALFFLHWFGDFVCQTRWMADNKSKNLLALTAHVSVYSLVLFTGLLFVHGNNTFLGIEDKVHGSALFQFVGINFVLHWLTDITTSQFTKYFWAKKNIHKFFATIGFDQFVHQVCLLATARAFLS